MSSDAPTTDSLPAPTAAAPLDEVMLAMDVVDTLRHQRAIVEAELGEEGRRAALVQRVRGIYADQGIEVPQEVIEEGVEALVRDRFVYRPPERTLRVRLAEIYVDRGKWFVRSGVVLALALVAFGLVAWDRSRKAKARREAYGAARTALEHEVERAGRRLEDLERQLPGPDDKPGPWHRLGQETAEELVATRSRLQRVIERLDGTVDQDAFDAAPGKMEDELGAARRDYGVVQSALGEIAGRLDVVRELALAARAVGIELDRLGGLSLDEGTQARLNRLRDDALAAIDRGDAADSKSRVQALRTAVGSVLGAEALRAQARHALDVAAARVARMTLDERAAPRVADRTKAVQGALASGDDATLRDALEQLERLLTRLEQSYTLRIVSRPDERSGVWRTPVERHDVRSYYIIVEAVGEDGRLVPLTIVSDEDQRVHTATRFGVRVPEAVYEQVKRDKQDNGIVDDAVFGAKRAGAFEPTYRFATAGGWIVSW
ncbi:MAG: DUF6384 family protein [Planctomycetota bacterium]